ncbi:MAG: S26 family signal peptidase [Clostridia bacterium]|nr:S26 family signal peptidase [Clostridia bacterium]
MNKTWKIVLNVIIWLFVAFALIVTIISLSASLGSQDGVPSVFGKSMMSVQSDSMKPTVSQGDMIIAEKPEDPVKMTLKVGDVITYRKDLNGDGIDEFQSHRIIRVLKNSVDIPENVITDVAGKGYDPSTPGLENLASIHYVTQGDNREMSVTPDAPVKWNYVVCVWHDGDAVLGGMGAVVDFLGSSVGFLCVIVLPLAVFFIFELISFISTITTIRAEKRLKEGVSPSLSKEEEDEIKRKAIEEYLQSHQTTDSDNMSAGEQKEEQ